MQSRRYPPGHVFHETRLDTSGQQLPDDIRRFECSCGKSYSQGPTDIVEKVIDLHLLQIGVQAIAPMVQSYGFTIDPAVDHVLIAYRTQERKVEAGPGWKSRLWDAMRELQPNLRGIGPGPDEC